MGMTMTQKILAAHAGLDSVKAGQLIMAKLDLVLGNDITSPVAINEFNKNGFNGVFDKDKIAILNFAFAFFNMIPLPPFDGSRVLFAFLPDRYYFGIMKYERYIMYAVLILLVSDILPFSMGDLAVLLFERIVFFLGAIIV